MKDWVSLFADYITPNGPNVTDACIAAGKHYINQLNQVACPTNAEENILIRHSKGLWSPKVKLSCEKCCFLLINFQANGAALKMFDASAKVSFTVISKINHRCLHLDVQYCDLN